MKKEMVLFIMIGACLLAGCGRQSVIGTESQKITSDDGKVIRQTDESIQGETISPEEKKSAESEEKEEFPDIQQKEAIDIGNTVDVVIRGKKNIAFTVKNVETTKTLGEHQPPDMWSPQQLSEDGTKTAEGFSFVWVELSIQNKEDSELDFPLGNMMPRRAVYEEGFGDDDLSGSYEVRTVEESNVQIQGKGHCQIEPGKEAELTLGYIMNDKILNDIYYQVGGTYAYEEGTETKVGLGERYFLKLFK